MLRIFFSRDDVARTRLAPTPDPLWELVLSLHLLHGGQGEAYFGHWRREVSRSLIRSGLAPQVRNLLAFCPPRGYFPDFLTPPEALDGLESGLEALRSTPVRALHRDLTLLAAHSPAPAGAAALARGEPSALVDLTDTMAAYHESAIAPYWQRIVSTVEADRARRSHAALDGGTEGLLASLRPLMRWQAGELCVEYPVDQEMHLDGRGLLLVPSYFCFGTPVTLLEESMPPVLVYPAERAPAPLVPGGAPNLAALSALLGGTRAAVLAAAGSGRTTTELARYLGVSPAAISQHAAVLRAAGLVTSVRDRNIVLHAVTPLGLAVLRGH